MSEATPQQGLVDEVQVFGVAGALAADRADMATSPYSHISVMQVPPMGETQVHNQGSDQILVVLRGECEVAGRSGTHALTADQGVLIPPDVSCRIRNTTSDELVFLSMQTRRPPGYVSNVPSDVTIKIPARWCAKPDSTSLSRLFQRNYCRGMRMKFL